MKKTLLSIATLLAVSVSAQGIAGISEKYAFDDFNDGSKFVVGNDPYTMSTNQIYWNDTTKQVVSTRKAFKGIFFWVDPVAGGFDFSWTRNPNKLAYTVTQQESAYEPFGLGFGQFAESATATKGTPFTLDLTSNKKVEVVIKNTSTVALEFRISMEDINGNLLNGQVTGKDASYNSDFAGVKINTVDTSKGFSGPELYEMTFTVPPGDTKTYACDYDTTSIIYYTTKTLGSTTECKNVGHYKTIQSSGFDFSKVKGLQFTPLNSTQVSDSEDGTIKAGDFPKCYGKIALTNGTFEFISLKMGDVPVSITDELVTETFKDEKVTVYNMIGSIIATGTTESITLNPGFYIIKSATKTQKVVIK